MIFRAAGRSGSSSLHVMLHHRRMIRSGFFLRCCSFHRDIVLDDLVVLHCICLIHHLIVGHCLLHLQGRIAGLRRRFLRQCPAAHRSKLHCDGGYE